MQQRSLFATLALASVLAVAGCASDHAGRSTASAQDDAALNSAVQDAVRDSPGVDTSGVRVSTHNGVVTLSGRAPTQGAAQDAIEAARHVPGVRKVDYDIKVDPD